MSMYYSPSPRETLMWLPHKSCSSRRKWNPILISRPRQGSFWGMLTVGGHCSYRTWTRCWQRSFLSPWISAAALGQTSLQERTECEPGVQWTPWGEDHVIEPPRNIDRKAAEHALPLKIPPRLSLSNRFHEFLGLVRHTQLLKEFQNISRILKPSLVERAQSNLLPESHLFLEGTGSGHSAHYTFSAQEEWTFSSLNLT